MANIQKGMILLTTQYQTIYSITGISELRSQLPKQIRQAVLAVIEADPTSKFFYKLFKANYQVQLFLIEHNPMEAFTVCHCFSTDIKDKAYSYESMPLSEIRTFFKFANELILN